jgi:hypothetical protein
MGHFSSKCDREVPEDVKGVFCKIQTLISSSFQPCPLFIEVEPRFNGGVFGPEGCLDSKPSQKA